MILVTEELEKDFENILIEANARVRALGFNMWDEKKLSVNDLQKQYKDGIYYIGYINNKPAFTAILMKKDDYFWNGYKSDAIYLHKFAISNAFVSLGYSKMIMNDIKKEVLKYKRNKLRIDVRGTAMKLRKFYENNDFTLVEEKQFYYGPGALYECLIPTKKNK